MKEIWKDIPNYEGIYLVSNLGRIKSLQRKVKNRNGYRLVKEKIMRPLISSKKYYKVTLSINDVKKSFNVHQLVAICFLNHKPNGSKIVVDHIDNNSFNNRFDNLQIITQRLNVSKDRKNGSSKYTGVCWHNIRKKWISTIRINGKKKHLGYFENEIDAHKKYQSELEQFYNKLK